MCAARIAVQLFSVRDACASDLPGTLRSVAEMGYEGVEFAGYYDRSAMELKTLLADVGLKVAGSHIGWNSLVGNELDRTMDFNEELGLTTAQTDQQGPYRHHPKRFVRFHGLEKVSLM